MATAKKAVAKKSVKTTVIETHHDRVDWRSLYLYAVCLITLLVALIFYVFSIGGVSDTTAPVFVYGIVVSLFVLFRLAVIIQQIWARYKVGQTTNPAFAGFGDAVNTLINRAEGKLR